MKQPGEVNTSLGFGIKSGFKLWLLRFLCVNSSKWCTTQTQTRQNIYHAVLVIIQNNIDRVPGTEKVFSKQ